MKIIKAGHEHIPHEGVTPYQFIERVGRTCYKSEDKITEDSAVKFVKGLVSRGHTAMIEHFWVHLLYKGNISVFFEKIEDFVCNDLNDWGGAYSFMRYAQVTTLYLRGTVFISCPIRMFTQAVEELSTKPEEISFLVREMLFKVQGAYFDFFNERSAVIPSDLVMTDNFVVMDEKSFINSLKKTNVPEWEVMKHNTHTFNFICNRGVSHELVRHRPCSFAQESTRYCNYSKDKFGQEITVIDPFTALYKDGNCDIDFQRKLWSQSIDFAESKYFDLLLAGATPQEARGVLPNDLKTEVVVTANETEWQHIVNLRSKQTTGKAHPQMVEVITPVYEELKVLSEGRIK